MVMDLLWHKVAVVVVDMLIGITVATVVGEPVVLFGFSLQ